MPRRTKPTSSGGADGGVVGGGLGGPDSIPSRSRSWCRHRARSARSSARPRIVTSVVDVVPAAGSTASAGVAAAASLPSASEMRRRATTFAFAIDDGRVGDVAVPPEGSRGSLEVRPIVGIEPVLGQFGQHGESRCAALPEIVGFIAPLLPDVVAGDRDCGEEDEPDGQQVELGQEPHPHGRQVERRCRVRREREGARRRRS